MAIHTTCDGVRRRDVLKVGVLGGAGLALPDFLRMVEAGQAGGGKVKAGIFINLAGGPSHLDTFDLKPKAPAEYRGLFKPIPTNVPGVEFCEHMPKLAKTADKFVILRGVSHSIGAHRLGSAYVNTGTRPLPTLDFPGYGAVATRELPSPRNLPPFVAIPNVPTQGPGFLGVKYAPLNTGTTPHPGRPFSIRGITLANGLTVSEIEKRHNLKKDLDTAFTGFEKDNDLLDGLDRFSEQAYQLITSKRSREAFDVNRESPAFAKPYGSTPFGRSCLLATRLVGAGVPFVTMSTGGWDTHRKNFSSLKNRLLPSFDEGFSALLNGLSERGLLESTAILVTGEFGRTPKLNKRSTPGGRDHYPRCMFMLMAGGKIAGGRVLGKSDDKATFPADGTGFKPDNIAASYYHNLGINPKTVYHSTTGRPITLVRDGQIIPELFA